MPLHDLHKPLLAAAVLAVVLTMAVAGVSLSSDDSKAADSSADLEYGGAVFSVYAYDGTEWHSDRVNAYDAMMAIMYSDMWSFVDSISVDGYHVQTFMGLESYDTVYWQCFCINVDGETFAVSGSLLDYRPYADQDFEFCTANIFLYYGTQIDADILTDLFSGYQNPVPLSDILEDIWSDCFSVEFHLSVDPAYDPVIQGLVATTDELKNGGLTVVGYGSTYLTALLDALTSSNVSGGESASIAQDYAGITIFGLSTEQNGDLYAGWYFSDSGSGSVDCALDQITPLGGDPLADRVIFLRYEEWDYPPAQWTSDGYSTYPQEMPQPVDIPDEDADEERTMWLYYDIGDSTSPGFGNQSWTGTTDAVFRIDSSEPVLEGHEFVGWARTADASEAEWQPGDTVTVPYGESLRIYAVWKEYFTVSFDTGAGSHVDSIEVLDGLTVSVPEEPTRDGWIFTGWFTDPSCQTPFSFLTPVTSDLVLHAGWVEENAFTSVPTIEANVVRADGTLRFDASGTSDAQRKVWYLDGEIVGYGDVLEVDLSTISEGSHTVTLEATNTEGTDTWTYSFSADVDDGGIPLWFWMLSAVMLVAAVLCLIRVPWLAIVPLAAEAVAALIVMIS